MRDFIGRWTDPWNRGKWDYVHWQIKWDNVMMRRRIRAGLPDAWTR